MKSIEILTQKRNEYAETLKKSLQIAKSIEDISNDDSDKLVKLIDDALTVIRMLDWVLDNEDIDFGEFCKKTHDDIAKEFGLNTSNQKEELK